MRKGISLSLETIVVLILAVLVLAVLLAFFSREYYDSDKKIELLRTQRDLCWSYTANDPKCQGINNEPIKSYDPNKLKELANACRQLGYLRCNLDAGIGCIQDCCAVFCLGTKSNTCEINGYRCLQRRDCPGEPGEGSCSAGYTCCK